MPFRSKAVVLGVISMLLGCQKFHVFLAQAEGNEVYFTSNAFTDECDGRLYASNIGVSRQNCAENCVAWDIVRESAHSLDDEPTTQKIYYGQVLPDMVTRAEAQPLSAGEYSIGADFACHEGGDWKGLRLFGKFSYLHNEDGVPVVKNVE